MDVNIPYPNPALTELLLSKRMQEIVLDLAEHAKTLYQAQVAKRTGRLAASAHASTEIAGVKHDRHVGVLTVGQGLTYGAAHEFGTDPHFHANAAHDLNRVLEEFQA